MNRLMVRFTLTLQPGKGGSTHQVLLVLSKEQSARVNVPSNFAVKNPLQLLPLSPCNS